MAPVTGLARAVAPKRETQENKSQVMCSWPCSSSSCSSYFAEFTTRGVGKLHADNLELAVEDLEDSEEATTTTLHLPMIPDRHHHGPRNLPGRQPPAQEQALHLDQVSKVRAGDLVSGLAQLLERRLDTLPGEQHERNPILRHLDRRMVAAGLAEAEEAPLHLPGHHHREIPALPIPTTPARDMKAQGLEGPVGGRRNHGWSGLVHSCEGARFVMISYV